MLSVPGRAGRRRRQPIVPGLKPFAGVTVLTRTARLTRRAWCRVALACASATVAPLLGHARAAGAAAAREGATRIARIAAFRSLPGRRRGASLQLLAASRKALRRRTAIRATLLAVAADGQGVQRTRTVPLRLRPTPAAGRRARAGTRPG